MLCIRECCAFVLTGRTLRGHRRHLESVHAITPFCCGLAQRAVHASYAGSRLGSKDLCPLDGSRDRELSLHRMANGPSADGGCKHDNVGLAEGGKDGREIVIESAAPIWRFQRGIACLARTELQFLEPELGDLAAACEICKRARLSRWRCSRLASGPPSSVPSHSTSTHRMTAQRLKSVAVRRGNGGVAATQLPQTDFTSRSRAPCRVKAYESSLLTQGPKRNERFGP
jgi:hypothetical protein